MALAGEVAVAGAGVAAAVAAGGEIVDGGPAVALPDDERFGPQVLPEGVHIPVA